MSPCPSIPAMRNGQRENSCKLMHNSCQIPEPRVLNPGAADQYPYVACYHPLPPPHPPPQPACSAGWAAGNPVRLPLCLQPLPIMTITTRVLPLSDQQWHYSRSSWEHELYCYKTVSCIVQCGNGGNGVQGGHGELQSSWDQYHHHPLPPHQPEGLSSIKLVPSAKNVGDH